VPGAFGLGTIANRLPRLHRLGRRRHDPTGINPGHLDVRTSRGPNQTQISPKANRILQGSPPTREPAGSQAYQQIEGDLKDLNPCLPGNLSLQGMVNLSQDQATPQLDLHHRPLRAPQVMQVEMVFQRSKCQLNGIITNDKFCLSRTKQLLKIPARKVFPPEVHYPSEAIEEISCLKKEFHEKTTVEHSPLHDRGA